MVGRTVAIMEHDAKKMKMSFGVKSALYDRKIGRVWHLLSFKHFSPNTILLLRIEVSCENYL